MSKKILLSILLLPDVYMSDVYMSDCCVNHVHMCMQILQDLGHYKQWTQGPGDLGTRDPGTGDTGPGTQGPGTGDPRTRGPKDLQLLRETEIQLHGYIIAWSMQVKSEHIFSIQHYPLACLHHFSTSECYQIFM